MTKHKRQTEKKQQTKTTPRGEGGGDQLRASALGDADSAEVANSALDCPLLCFFCASCLFVASYFFRL